MRSDLRPLLGPYSVRGRLPLVRYFGAGNSDDADQGFQAREVIGVGGEQRQPFGDRRGRDHQVDYSPPWLSAGSDDSRRYSPVDAGRFSVERHRIELALSPLQDVEPPGSLGVLVVAVLLVAAADLMR